MTNTLTLIQHLLLSSSNMVMTTNETLHPVWARTNSVLVTNQTVLPYNPAKHNHIFFTMNGAPMSEKWVTTEISRRDSIWFNWMGKDWTNINLVPITNHTEHLRIKQEWEVVK